VRVPLLGVMFMTELPPRTSTPPKFMAWVWDTDNARHSVSVMGSVTVADPPNVDDA